MTGRMIVAGIGCRRGATSHDIITLVRRALEVAAGGNAVLGALATPRFKGDEPGLTHAATMLGVPLTLVDEAALIAAQPRCATTSVHAAATTGVASVAEGAALAAAGADAILLLPRISGSGVTCALARKAP